METFVLDNAARAEQEGLRLKHNRPQGNPEDKTRRRTIWEGKQTLIAAGLPKESIVFSRKRFWNEAPVGTVTELGALEGDDKIQWGEAAPAAVRNSA